MIGHIHSFESFGAVDGPGVRFVVFLQGCPMRCAYCHNPDTWNMSAGTEITCEEILNRFERNRAFYKNGGITVTGGEPLLQADFVHELFYLAKKKGISTCLDTSGICFIADDMSANDSIRSLLTVTDLVMLDLKQFDDKKHLELTGHSNKNVLAFAKYLSTHNIPTWIRVVLVPGLTDDETDLIHLGEFIATLKNIQAIDVLPYHTMGIPKYKALQIPYRLEGIPDMDTQLCIQKKNILLQAIMHAH